MSVSDKHCATAASDYVRRI